MKYIIALLIFSNAYASQSIYPDNLVEGIFLSKNGSGAVIACVKTEPSPENIEHRETPMQCHKFYKSDYFDCIGTVYRELICKEKVGI